MSRLLNSLLIACFVACPSSLALEEAFSPDIVQLAQKPTAAEAAVVPATSSLPDAIKQYRLQASEGNWSLVSAALKAYLQQPGTLGLEPSILIHSQAGLNELGVKIVHTGAARVWLFPQVEHCHGAFVQWKEVKVHPAPKRRGRRRVAAPPTITYHLAYIAVPGNVLLKDAKLLENGSQRFLLLAGSDIAQHNMWLKSYLGLAEGWRENNYPLSLIPPFLLNNLNGRVSFSGSELILAVDTGRSKISATGGEEPLTYKIALHLIDGRYALDGRMAPDSPQSVVYQFAQAIQAGRVDVAKAWLSDPSLANIPRYLGLTNKGNGLKVVNISGAPAGVYRFRWITFEKDDLIVDVTRSKMQWVIKAIFIAPADPVWQKIAKNMPGDTKVHDGNQSAVRKDAAGATNPKPLSAN